MATMTNYQKEQAEPEEQEQTGRPLATNGSFRLLGLKLDGQWSFQGNVAEIREKMRAHIAFLRKLSGTSSGLENRRLTTTAHALVGCALNYGLTATGRAISEVEFRQVDTKVLNPVARQIAGVSPTTRREVIFTLADLRSTQNHFRLKTANIEDRALRAKGSRAQRAIRKYLGGKDHLAEKLEQTAPTLRNLKGGTLFHLASER